nr:hypothetical protein Iba_scaffold8000.4CG0500 [Ipomoea batatas]
MMQPLSDLREARSLNICCRRSLFSGCRNSKFGCLIKRRWSLCGETTLTVTGCYVACREIAMEVTEMAVLSDWRKSMLLIQLAVSQAVKLKLSISRR